MNDLKYPSSAVFYSGYASYHTNNLNRKIHLYCVPVMWLSGFALLDAIGLFFSFSMFGSRLWANPSVLLIPHFLYIVRNGDVVPAFVTAVGCWYAAGLAYLLTTSCGLWIFWPMLLIHLGSWGAQLYGHNTLEKNKPAFVHNVVNAICSAPYFLTMEVLFIFGWNEEYKKLCEECTNARKLAGLHL